MVKELNIGAKHARWMVLAFVTAMLFMGLLAKFGVTGDLLGYSGLAIAFAIWSYGYLRTLNKVIAPRVKEFL